MTYENEIDKKFYKKDLPVARNVGELKLLLSELPDSLPIDEDQVSVVVFNIKKGNTHLSFQEDGW